ncbi:MAG TPA: hypothetical protein VFI47_09995, partial [Acidimicrobiales bacterium]|nr:hypothetical protein [Acidimicrobiales bacterium]
MELSDAMGGAEPGTDDEATTSARRVAAELAAAFGAGPDEAQRVLRSLYAGSVELRHVPALPSDGVVDGERLAESSGREAAMVRRALPDQRYDGIDVSVDGDRFDLRTVIRGTLADGAAVRIPTRMRGTVLAGRIVAIEHVLDAETIAAWTEVAAAGGLAE